MQELQARVDQQPPRVVHRLRRDLSRPVTLLDLPAEILIEILRYYVASHMVEMEGSDDIYSFGIHALWASKPSQALPLREWVSWLSIGLVCRHIRELFLQDPVLWTDQWLQGIPWTEYSLKHIPVQLPLRVKGGIGTRIDQIQRILSHGSQIQVLDLRCTTGLWVALSGLENNYQFPLLDTLKLSSPYDRGTLGRVPHFLVGALSQVYCLMLNNISIRDIFQQSSNLRELRIICHANIHETNPIQYYQRLLDGLPNLESFELTASARDETVGPITHLTTLSHLRTLRLCFPYVSDYVLFLAPLRLPQCTHVHVQIQRPPDDWSMVVEALSVSQVFRDRILSFHCDSVPDGVTGLRFTHALRLRFWTEIVSSPLPGSCTGALLPRLTVQLGSGRVDPIELYDITSPLPLTDVHTLAIYTDDDDDIFGGGIGIARRSDPQDWSVPRMFMNIYTRRWMDVLGGMPRIVHLHVEGPLCHVLPPCLQWPHDLRNPLLAALETLCVDRMGFVPHSKTRGRGQGESELNEHGVLDEIPGDLSHEMLADALKFRREMGYKVKKLVFGRGVSHGLDGVPMVDVLASIREVVDEVMDYSLR